MAETSGFFEAQWDETLVDPVTGNLGDWDRRYLADQFANYFSRFIGNGVFASPAEQLKVRAGEGLQVIVSEGYAFINGYWYHNDSELAITIPTNATASARTDSIRLRWSAASRSIEALCFAGDVDVVRNDTYYDLEIAQVIVPAVTTAIEEKNVSDMRPNENYCGFVTGLIEVIGTEALFSQFQAIFDDWFDGVKGQITQDMAVRLQQEIDQKEPSFSKNTAFNKNFGDSVGTVCEGNDPRLSNARPASDVQEWAKASKKPTYTKDEVGLGNVDNTADANKSVLSASKLTTAVNIGEASFDGSRSITLQEIGAKKIRYATSEPDTVEDNEIVFVYEV